MKPSRGDKMWISDPEGPYTIRIGGEEDSVRPVTDADLAAMGLVQAPECGECGGSGLDDSDEATAGGDEAAWDCPKCGGSGYGRLVSLDVDVELIRGGWEAYTKDNHTTAALSWARLARQVLAALDEREDS